MARSSVIFAVSLLAAFVGIASAVRPEPAVNAGHWASSLEESSDGITNFGYGALAAHTAVGSDDKEFPFRLLTKFIIRPSIGKEFAKGYLKYRSEALKATGAKAIGLTKPLSDNLLFFAYEEWESKSDFFKWVKSKDSAAKKLAEYIEEENIPIVLTQLLPITPPPHHHGGHHGHKHGKKGHGKKGHGHHHEHRHEKHQNEALSTTAEVVEDLLADVTDTVQDLMQSEKGQDAGDFDNRSLMESAVGKGKKEWTPIALGRFVVKPSQTFQFIAAANLLSKAVKEEGGAKDFVFSKTTSDDVVYYLYAKWESKEAVKAHFESESAKLFRQYVLDHDIYIKQTLAIPLEKLDD